VAWSGPAAPGLIGALLPPAVVVVEVFGDPPGPPLLPAEDAIVARSGPERRQEFTTARRCAREAMARLGLPPAPLLPGPRRGPSWPAGVVGSLTHCRGYRAAAVARVSEVAAVGIDADLDVPLPPGTLALVARPEEMDRLALLPAGKVCWDKLLFSVKEAIYKSWQPLSGQALDFAEASVMLDPGGTFRARLTSSRARSRGPRPWCAGRWMARAGLVAAALVWPVPPW
jgi:4'-phosphopantetheinyl transferase EntD